MENDWEILKKTLASNYTGNLGVFDIHADALQNITVPALQGIQGYPTVFSYKDNIPITYEGDRSSTDLLNFGLKHLDLQKIIKLYERKN